MSSMMQRENPDVDHILAQQYVSGYDLLYHLLFSLSCSMTYKFHAWGIRTEFIRRSKVRPRLHQGHFFAYDTRLIASVFVYCLALLCWFPSQFVMAIKLQTASDLDSLPPQSWGRKQLICNLKLLCVNCASRSTSNEHSPGNTENWGTILLT